MNKYLKSIERFYPEIKIETYEQMAHGQNNEIYVINESYIFRFPKTEINRRILFVEADCLAILKEKLSFRIPEYEYIHFGEHLYDTFVGYKMIPGVMLTKAILGSKNSSKIGYQLSEILKEIHAPELKDLLKSRVKVVDPYVTWGDLYQRVIRHLFDYMPLDKQREVTADFNAILDNLAETHFESVLVHGDFGPTNILVDEKSSEIVGIIDFGELHVGDPAVDISAMIGPFGFGEAFILDTFDAYPEAKEMLHRAKLFTKTFALQEALYGIENDDKRAFEAGMKGYMK